MPTAAETIFLAVMVVFGVATAGVLAFMLRDVAARLATGRDESGAGEGADGALPPGVAEAQRIAMLGPAVYLVGFLLVVAATLLDLGPVGGVNLVDAGMVVIVLGAVPMAVGLDRAWQAG